MEIKPYPKNAKKHPEKQIKQLAMAIKAFGFSPAIEVDPDGVIISGHGRYLASQELGLTELKEAPRAPKGADFIPYIILDDLTPTEIKQKRLADNKLAETDVDMILALEELKEIELEGGDVTLTGYDKDLLIEPDEKDDEVPEVPKEPQSKLGDLYELGNHRVLCGDSTKIEDVERLMDGKKADMVFTDPPYGNGVSGKYGRGQLGIRTIEGDVDFSITELVLLNLKELPQLFFLQWRTFAEAHSYLTSIGKGIKTIAVWDKKNAGLNGAGGMAEQWEAIIVSKDCKYKKFGGNVFAISREHKSRTDSPHPHQKPIQLLLELFNFFDASIFIDPFLGSGSTLIASEKTGRICYGMELDPKYVDVIVQRYIDYTGNTEVVKNGKKEVWQKTK